MLHRFDHSEPDEILVAGQLATPGIYRAIDTGRSVVLEREDVLPASLDGKIACYVRVDNTWAEVGAREALVK